MSDSEYGAVAVLGTIFVFLFFAVVSYVIYAIVLTPVFKKAGVETWKAWVPIANVWGLLEMGGQPGARALFVFIPFVGPVITTIFLIMALIEINNRFQQTGGMLALAILLTVIYFAVIGFGSARWNGPLQGSVSSPPPPPPVGTPLV